MPRLSQAMWWLCKQSLHVCTLYRYHICLTDICTVTHSPHMQCLLAFTILDLPPPHCPPHFHGHTVKASCVLRGQYDAWFRLLLSSQLLIAQQPCPGLTGPCNNSVSNPSMYVHYIGITYTLLMLAAQPTAHQVVPDPTMQLQHQFLDVCALHRHHTPFTEDQ